MGKGYLRVFGFVLFVLGFLSIILNMVGISLKPLQFLNDLSFGFLIKLGFLVFGLIILYIDSTWDTLHDEDHEI